MKLKHVLTTCVYCGCGCGIHLVCDGEKVIGSYPSGNHPVSNGALCVKGWNIYEFINKSDRLTNPLIKENGVFKEAKWEKALSLTASRLKEISEKYGPDSVAFLSSAKTTNEENYLMMKLSRAVFKTNNVDHCARLCHASTVVGLAATFGSGAMTNSIDEFEEAEVFLVTGSDTTAQHPLIGSRIVNSVLEKNAKLIVIDPRKIELSKYAQVYCAQKNGTDVAWINGMMNVIITEDLQDKEYIKERVDEFEALKELVREYTPEKVEEITSIPKEKLIEAARIYAKAKKAMIVYAMGITQHTTGVDNVKSLANLAMLSGHVGFDCTGVNPLRGQNNVQGACDMGALSNVFSGYQKVVDEAARKKFEKAWGVENLPDKVGLTVTEIIDGAATGKIKGLYIVGENPVISDPDSTHVRKALENLEFLAVQDIFMTDTSEYADVVLAGASFAEKDGTFTNTERRCERIRKAIDCVGTSKADWEIICEIAKRCGYDGMNYSHPSEIMDEIAAVTPIYGGMAYDRLDPWGLQWPCPDKAHPGTKFLHKGKFSKGKGTFMPCAYKPPAELPDKEYDFTLSTGRVYWHWHTGTLTRRTSTLEREAPEAYVEMHPENAEKLKVRTGSLVKVTSRRGSIDIKVKVTEEVVKDSVFIPFHFKEAAANVLTNPAVDPVAKIPEYKVCAVKVEKI
ncbi:MAG: formate dehydrogenase subunit alpha [Candidatus Omnitrophica bacterium]|nr:formate dehydrogenase subunit alpha [Candidatus Omnitrophota bacterium]